MNCSLNQVSKYGALKIKTDKSFYSKCSPSSSSSVSSNEEIYEHIAIMGKSSSNKKKNYFDYSVYIPESDESHSFSWRKLWAFTGPGFLMSIAYLDPGNIESDLRAGSIAEYKLLWVLLWSTFLGLLMQRLAARLGTVTGLHLANLCYKRYPKLPRILLWIMIEIAIVGSDMQEVIGTAIALHLLSSGRISVFLGVIITICDTFTFLFLDKYGLRKLEGFFGFLIAIMAITFGFEFFEVKPSSVLISKGLIIPWCSNCSYDALIQAIGIVGAIIMPHNLYLHSALVKTRKIDRTKKESVREANRYVFIEALIALIASLLINISVTSVFAHGLYGVTNSKVHHKCLEFQYPFSNTTFPDNDEKVDADIYKAGIFLGCYFGLPALYIWAIGLFAAGQSSTMTGTYSGQFVMEGFLNLHWAKWKRVLFTRTLAIAPTLLIAGYREQDLTNMNDLLNALMSLQLPFALIPTLTFTSSERVMGLFRNNFPNIIIASLLSLTIIAVNIYFVSIFVFENLPKVWWVILLVVLFIVFYVIFVFYLIGCFLVVIGFSHLQKVSILGKYFEESTEIEHSLDNNTNSRTNVIDISN